MTQEIKQQADMHHGQLKMQAIMQHEQLLGVCQEALQARPQANEVLVEVMMPACAAWWDSAQCTLLSV